MATVLAGICFTKNDSDFTWGRVLDLLDVLVLLQRRLGLCRILEEVRRVPGLHSRKPEGLLGAGKSAR
jgi:hypothetical protein